MTPPLGTVPDFAHPPNDNDLGFGIIIASITIATLLVAARTFARVRQHRKTELDDVSALVALGLFAAFHYFTWQIVSSPGLFVHQWNVKLKDMPGNSHHMIVANILYGFVMMMLKTAILLHWTKVFAPFGLHNGFRWTCYITIGINIIFYVTFTCIEAFGCNPREKLWDVSIEGKCLEVAVINISSAFVNFFSDLIILLLPHRIIWKLQMSTSKKIGVAAIFAVGVLYMPSNTNENLIKLTKVGSAVACAGSRIKSTFNLAHTEDNTYAESALGLWCVAETTAGFFVPCHPSMPQLFRNTTWIQKLVSRFTPASNSASQTPGPLSERKLNWPLRTPDSSLLIETKTSNVDYYSITVRSSKSYVLGQQFMVETPSS